MGESGVRWRESNQHGTPHTLAASLCGPGGSSGVEGRGGPDTGEGHEFTFGVNKRIIRLCLSTQFQQMTTLTSKAADNRRAHEHERSVQHGVMSSGTLMALGDPVTRR